MFICSLGLKLELELMLKTSSPSQSPSQHVVDTIQVYPDDQGIYTCRATNPFGEDETTAPLTVTDVELLEASDLSVQPRFLLPLEPTTALEGNPVEMKVEVTAVPSPAIQWFFHGRPITSSRDHKISTKGKKSNLVIPEAMPEDSGPYSVSAVNPVGSATSKANLRIIRKCR